MNIGVLAIIILLVAVAIVGATYCVKAARASQTANRRVALGLFLGNHGLTTEGGKVLLAMSGAVAVPAAALVRITGLSHPKVVAERRKLREMEFAHFGPIPDPDGAGVRGTGYTLTPTGLAAKAELRGALA